MRTALSAVQWAMFILAGSVVAPLAIGQAYGLTPQEIAEFVQRTLFVLGIVSILQALFGHRLPIMEGPAVLWWGVFLLFAQLSSGMGMGLLDILKAFELGLLASGVIFLLMSFFKWMEPVRKLFTPTVIGTYFLLLVAQMSGPFLNGILGTSSQTVNWSASAISLATLIVAITLARSRNGLLRSFSVLIAIVFGWSLFALAGLYHPFDSQTGGWFSLPKLFVWGWPEWNGAILFTSFLVTLLLLSNLMASVEAVEKVVKTDESADRNRSVLVMGGSQMLSGVFSTVGFVPLSYTAGFILTTKMKEKLPFLLGSLLLLLISFFPPVTMWFASIPVPVGYASVFLSFANMIGMGLKELADTGLDERNRYVVGISLMTGMGSMFLPAAFLSQLPAFISPLASNGLLVGVFTCILLEQATKVRDDAGAGVKRTKPTVYRSGSEWLDRVEETRNKSSR
jgi:xanthine/uracil permease